MLPRLTTILIIVVGLVTLSLYFSRPKLYRQEFKAYFKNGRALRSGASVRISGIEAGMVKSVQIRPEHRETPVEVVFEVQTPYPLQIPRDSTVSLNSDGLLGQTALNIDLTHATGPPAAEGAVLQADEGAFSDAGRVIFDRLFGSDRSGSKPNSTVKPETVPEAQPNASPAK